MKHLVAVDSNSVIGATLLAGTNDGIAVGGHPLIDCTAIEDVGPYMFCTRLPKKAGGSSQLIRIPHQAIAYVLSYAKAEERPIGFG